MHFVEDQNGKVQDVVNMTEQGQANVETTTDGEIQKQNSIQRVFQYLQSHGEEKAEIQLNLVLTKKYIW